MCIIFFGSIAFTYSDAIKTYSKPIFKFKMYMYEHDVCIYFLNKYRVRILQSSKLAFRLYCI